VNLPIDYELHSVVGRRSPADALFLKEQYIDIVNEPLNKFAGIRASSLILRCSGAISMRFGDFWPNT